MNDFEVNRDLCVKLCNMVNDYLNQMDTYMQKKGHKETDTEYLYLFNGMDEIRNTVELFGFEFKCNSNGLAYDVVPCDK